MFDRIIELIGNDKFELLRNKKVLIVGCGGVGGYLEEVSLVLCRPQADVSADV